MTAAIHVAPRRGAVFGANRTHRYRLFREWDRARPRILFVLLNPSTADARRDDATSRRCQHFARALGGGSVEVVNLFGFRATDPAALLRSRDPIGIDNDRHLLDAAAGAARIVAGWGNHGSHLARDRQVLELLGPFAPIECLGLTASGAPRHPLYLHNATRPMPYPGP